MLELTKCLKFIRIDLKFVRLSNSDCIHLYSENQMNTIKWKNSTDQFQRTLDKEEV